MNINKLAKYILWKVYKFPSDTAQMIGEIVKRRKCIADTEVILYASCNINNRGKKDSIQIGRGSKIMCKIETYRYGGQINIGEYCFIGDGTRIWSATSVKIGNRVLISHNVNIHDTNSHSMSAASRHEHFNEIFYNRPCDTLDEIQSKPIVIEDDAWIGFGSAIFKGVTIGQGAVVAAMSVVTKDVPAYTVVGGNPARALGASQP